MTKHSICGVCQLPFSYIPSKGRLRLTCSQTCSGKLGAKTHPGAWSKDEDKLLGKFAHRYSLGVLVRRYQDASRRRGFPIRTKPAIHSRLYRLGYSLETSLDNWSITGLARLLDIETSRIRRWISDCGLRYQKVSETLGCIDSRDLKEFAQNHPDKFFGIERQTLIDVLGYKIAKMIPENIENPRSSKPIRRRDTGKIYPSLRKCSQALFISAAHISASLQEKKPACGIFFEYV